MYIFIQNGGNKTHSRLFEVFTNVSDFKSCMSTEKADMLILLYILVVLGILIDN